MANVLVADDEASVRGVLCRMLTNLGHQPREVADGAEALQLLDGVCFDLIISDVYMASLDGMELLDKPFSQEQLRLTIEPLLGGGVP